jgi:hypothetical protein
VGHDIGQGKGATLVVPDNSTKKGRSGMDKFGSIIDRMNMKLGSKILNSLRIKVR